MVDKPSLELETQIKEQELRLKKAEAQAKERDLTASKWLNPVVIGLFVAAVGLIGNVIVTTINSRNAQELERSRNQSTLILEAIKTNGDTIAACRNLIFFESLGLLEDTNHIISQACPVNIQGLPSVFVGPPDHFAGVDWYPLVVQTFDEKGAPISGASVDANLILDAPIEIPPSWSDTVSSGKYLGVDRWTMSGHCLTEKGECVLGMAPSGKFIAIAAQRKGYAGGRVNTLVAGKPIIVVLQKSH
jgi:hypothetical protein